MQVMAFFMKNIFKKNLRNRTVAFIFATNQLQ